MNEIKTISNSLEETIKDTDLQDVTIDLAETLADTLLNDGIIKDIPILATIIGLGKTGLNIKDRLFLKKIIYFISELKNIPAEKRNELITKIDSSGKYRIKVGEKLLYIIDKCEDHTTSQYVAILFSAFLNEEINYPDFLRGSTIIQKLLVQDLEQFLETETKQLERKITQWDKGLSDFENSLITVGICSTYADAISVR